LGCGPVSAKFVNDMVMVKRETGALHPRARGNGGGHGKLKVISDSIKGRRVEKPCLTLDDLVVELAARHIWIARRQPFMRNVLPRIGFTPSRQHALHAPAGQWTKPRER
jgi:hypothetical protein